jgi:hypothetical protein
MEIIAVMKNHQTRVWVLVVGIVAVAVAGLAETNEAGRAYFVGWERDPAMEYGGRDVVSLHGVVCRGMEWMLPVKEHPLATFFYESYLGVMFSTVQHEMFGHGSRAREFGLNPSYGFGLDLSGWTSVGKDPESNEQNILLGAGGTEADTVLARGILLDLYSGTGTDAARIPLMGFAKLDFSLYCLGTVDPLANPEDFTTQYEDGNDIAYYLVSRQAQRRGGDPAVVWDNDYAIDFTEASFGKTYEDLQAAAVWNLMDPAMLVAGITYLADHLGRGQSLVRPPVLPLGDGVGVTAGTRACIGPDAVSRFLDVYVVTPGHLFTVYVRDLKSLMETTYGAGGGMYGVPVGERVTGALFADYWVAPESPEGVDDGNGWNMAGEMGIALSPTLGVNFKLGGKSDGFFPGVPVEAGVYGGAGVQVVF